MTTFPNEYGAFLRRHLERLLPGLIEQKQQVLPFSNGSWIPSNPVLDRGTDTIRQEVLTKAAEAVIMSDQSSVIPLSSVAVSSVTRPTVAIASSFGYHTRDLDRQMMAERNGSQVNLMGARQTASIQAIDEKVELLTTFGNPAIGFQGTVNNPDVPVWDGSPFDPNEDDDDEIIKFFSDIVTTLNRQTRMTIPPNTMLVSLDLFSKLNQPNLVSGGKSLLSFILEVTRPMGIETIMPSLSLGHEDLEKFGVKDEGSDEDRIMVYRRDPTVLNRAVLSSLYAFGELEGPIDMNYKTPIYTVISPTHFDFPDSALYVDHPKIA